MRQRLTNSLAALAVLVGALGLFSSPAGSASVDTPLVMPVNGTVSVTGFGVTSLVHGSSDPTTVVLSHYEALELRAALAELSGVIGSPQCMEDSALLYVKVVAGSKTIWNAIADECPGEVRVTVGVGHAVNDRSCAFWHLVNGFFAPPEAAATKRDSLSVCADPLT